MRLRIISGIYKGRLIKVPQSKLIRPTTDRVRETLFNVLTNKINFSGISILELYAGSGAAGLECISRGASNVTFVEKNFHIYKNLIENISSLNAKESCQAVRSTSEDFIKIFSEKAFNLILADPPFSDDNIYSVVENIKAKSVLKNDGILIIERSIKSKENDIHYFKGEPIKIIGNTCLYEVNL